MEVAGAPALQKAGVAGHGDVERVHNGHALIAGIGQHPLVVPQQLLLVPLQKQPHQCLQLHHA